jgi:hypothetical protein
VPTGDNIRQLAYWIFDLVRYAPRTGFKESIVPTEETNEAIRREWRELGFFYELNDDVKEWLFRGSRAGLLTFARSRHDYSNNPRHRQVSEHDHFGPYMYLKIATWDAPEITDHWIAGTLEDLSRLSVLVGEQVLKAKTGDMLRFRKAYAPSSAYELVLEMCDDEFEPAAADRACW